jgi:hypothetical protein
LTEEAIPEALASFIVGTFRSIADLEAVLLLLDPAQPDWTAEQVAARLYVPESEARQVLAYLVARGLAVADGNAVRYAAGAEDDAAVRRVAKLYATHLIPVTKLIHQRPQSRIQQFADAFKLKKAD